MKRMLSLLLALAMLVGMLPAALAEAAHTPYTPGELSDQLFAAALESGHEVCTDLSMGLALDAETGDPETDALLAMVQEILDSASLNVGVAAVEDGFMLDLGGTYAKGEESVNIGAQLTVNKAGLELVSSSLLPGERVTITWETLLSLCGMDESQIATVMSLCDMTPEEIEAAITEALAAVLPLVEQTAAPYIEILTNFAAGLPMAEVPAESELFPGVAKAMTITVTEKAYGEALTALMNQLEQDETLAPMLDMLFAQAAGEGETAPTVAELCAALREEAAAMTDEEHPVVLSIGLSENDEPLSLSIGCSIENASFSFDLGSTAADTVLAQMSVTDGEETVGAVVQVRCTEDPADPNVVDVDISAALTMDDAAIMAFSMQVVTTPMLTEAGMSGYDSVVDLAMDIVDGDDVMSTTTSVTATTALTPDGGESTSSVGVTKVNANGVSVQESLAQVDYIVVPGELGPEADWIETVVTPLDEQNAVAVTFAAHIHTLPYAPDASLTALALDTASDEDMEALSMRAVGNGLNAVGKLMELLPEGFIEMLMTPDVEMIEEATATAE